MRKRHTTVFKTTDPQGFFLGAMHNQIRFSVAVQVRRTNSIGSSQAGERRSHVQTLPAILLKIEYAGRIRIGNNDVAQAVSVEITDGNITIFSRPLLAESILNQTLRQFRLAELLRFDLQKL